MSCSSSGLKGLWTGSDSLVRIVLSRGFMFCFYEGEWMDGRSYTVRRSGVHGFGVFALKKLETGEVIGALSSKGVFDLFLPESFVVRNKSVFDVLIYWMNHSCVPNAYIDSARLEVRALREIAQDEEIFYDYGRDGVLLECSCGSSLCRGVFQKRSAV